MGWINVEIKASCLDIEKLAQILAEHQADYKGEDHQIDTYFNVPNGRLKLREGNIENALIHYHRDNQIKPKTSSITYYKPGDSKDLKATLTEALGIKIVVDKRRKIFFINNIKFHLDRVKELGTFVEIEAIDENGTIGQALLQKQCYQYMEILGIGEEDLLAISYSDLLLEQSIG
ncbi:class IV adenylate cyclase [Aureispira anguillae]|uniref:Class IV adenylate cyclase n=1 Tax=Aureispira anguillae TaxID=2864201 RepID=A0A916DWC4_9BACT|nr:class IV adenylate cyclase [Aureispira anguillae]BDS14530.1 class IV adenylate cyclase [Aureispira anguillae]